MARYWHWIVLAVAGMGTIVSASVSHYSEEQLLAIAAGLVILVAQVRWPLTAGAVQIGLFCMLGLIPGFIVPTSFIAFITLVDMNSRRPAWVGCATSLTTLVVGSVGLVLHGSPLAWAFSFIAATVLFSGVGMFLRAIVELQAQSAELSRLRMAAQRQVMAREMHDVVAYGLSQVVLRSRLAEARTGLDPEAAKDFQGVGKVARQSLEEVRSVIAVLNESSEAGLEDQVLDAGQVVTDLDQVEADLRSSGFEPVLTNTGDTADLPLVTRYLLSRAIRELAANMVRHADPALPVSIDTKVDESGVHVVATNTIASQEKFPTSGMGLHGLRDRIEGAGGTLDAGAEGDTWTTSVFIPRRAT